MDEDTEGEQPGIIGPAYGLAGVESPGTVVVTGENFAPTAQDLLCEFFADSGGAARGDQARHITSGAFASGTRVACALPQGVVGETLTVHVRVAPGVPLGSSVASVVYYDPTAPAALSSVSATSTGRAYADVALVGGQILVEVRGANFAPTNLKDAPEALRCGLWPEAAANVEARMLALAEGSVWEEPPPPVPGQPDTLEVAAVATFVSAGLVRCSFDTSLMGCRGRGDCGNARLRVAHALGDFAWSNSSLLFTLFDSSRRTTLRTVQPTYADRAGPVTLTVRGSNFAPGDPIDVRCRFRSAAGDAYSNATVLTSELLTCVAPSASRVAEPNPPLGVIDELVQARLARTPLAHARRH